ncbi:hypothetical protein FACS1894172_03480 [Spirochaetia bacterium]|nr:hypothetical protein FACS1894172_03480 [Spirochaetia bacterium]
MFNILAEMFSYTFLVRAITVGVLVSLCAALLGVSLVLKRFSMIGDGLSHVGFGTLAAATALNVAPLTISIPVVIIAAFLLLRISENSKIKGDAAIALISSSALAIGVVIISMTTGMNTDVCNYLFGSILAMSKSDVYLSIALSIAVLVLFLLFYNKLFAITFDETFARATGVPVRRYTMLIAFLTAVTIVLGMRMMGAMLISSLIIFPALSSMRVCKTFRSVTICAAIISLFCFFSGIIISYIYATPTGASVVIMNLIIFLLFWVLQNMQSKIHLAKKASFALLACAIIFSGCNNAKPGPAQKNQAGTQAVNLAGIPDREIVPVNFTDEKGVVEIKEKMFIAQTNDVYLNPEDYLGKTIKLEGLFKSDTYLDADTAYHFVLRYGPGCCGTDGNAGFEVAWDQAYPQEDEWVEAVGLLSSYEEDGYPYLYIQLSSLNVLENRGAEFVSQ